MNNIFNIYIKSWSNIYHYSVYIDLLQNNLRKLSLNHKVCSRWLFSQWNMFPKSVLSRKSESAIENLTAFTWSKQFDMHFAPLRDSIHYFIMFWTLNNCELKFHLFFVYEEPYSD